jgi:hypothetical protein
MLLADLSLLYPFMLHVLYFVLKLQLISDARLR